MENRKLRFAVNVAVLAVLFIVSSSGCSGPGATLSSAEGDVSISRTGTDVFIEGSAGMKLKPGDSIKTGNDATVVIIFFDGSAIELQPNTRLQISSLKGRKSSTVSILLEQKAGETVSRVIKLVDPKSRYEIETASAIATVRGTTMMVSVAFNGLTALGTEDGKASIIAQGVEVEVPAGYHSTAAPGQRPAQPRSGITPIDSLINDPRATVISDPCGDMVEFARGARGADLETVWALMDADNIYVAFKLCDTFDSSLLRNYFSEIYVDGEDGPHYSIGVRPYYVMAANWEAGSAWTLLHDTTSPDRRMIGTREAPEVTAYWKLDSGLLEMVIPKKDYFVGDNVLLMVRSTDGKRDLDVSAPLQLTTAAAE